MTKQVKRKTVKHKHKGIESNEDQDRAFAKSSIIARKLDLLEKSVDLIMSKLNEKEKAVHDLMESHGLLWACGPLSFDEADTSHLERKGRGRNKLTQQRVQKPS